MQQGGPSRVNTHLNRIVALVVGVAATFVASGVAPDRVDAQPTPDYEVSIPSWTASGTESMS